MTPKITLAIATLFCLVCTVHAGVLIGRPPEHPESSDADLRDLHWALQGDSITLTVVAMESDGRLVEHPFRSVSTTMVRQALRYAADARPLAVTMIQSEPLADLKILLHPSLEDTRLGWAAIRLDTFVDTYAGELQSRKNLLNRVWADHCLYKAAWAVQVRATPAVLRRLALGIEAKDDNNWLERIREFHKEYRQAHDALAQSSRDGVKDVSVLPADSLLRRKPEYYDPVLVDAIAGVSVDMTADEFVVAVESRLKARFGELARIQEQAEDLARRVHVWDPGQQRRSRVEQWSFDALLSRADDNRLKKEITLLIEKGTRMLSLPTFTDWSGVRERPYEGKLADYVLPSSFSCYPFRFVVQIAFKSLPAFLETGWSEDYSDETPYEFTSIKTEIKEAILKGLRGNPQGPDMKAMEEMATFTILQRLFRAAMAGHLGKNFPMERLLELADALGPPPPNPATPTPRWLPEDAKMGLEGLMQLAAALKKLESRVPRKEGEKVEGWIPRAAQEYHSRIAELKKTSYGADSKASSIALPIADLLLEWARGQGPAVDQQVDSLLSSDSFSSRALGFIMSQRVAQASQPEDGTNTIPARKRWMERWRSAVLAVPVVNSKQSDSVNEVVQVIRYLDNAIQIRQQMHVLDAKLLWLEYSATVTERIGTGEP